MIALQVGVVVAVFGLTVLVLVGVIVSSAMVTVRADERAILTVLGERRQVLEPGLTIVPPLVSKVHRIPVDEQELRVEVEALTADDTATAVEATLTVTVEDAERAFEAGYERTLADRCRDRLRDNVSHLSYQELVGDRRPIALELRDDLDVDADEVGARVRSVELTIDRTDR